MCVSSYYFPLSKKKQANANDGNSVVIANARCDNGLLDDR